jgi:hypothetical protein
MSVNSNLLIISPLHSHGISQDVITFFIATKKKPMAIVTFFIVARPKQKVTTTIAFYGTTKRK